MTRLFVHCSTPAQIRQTHIEFCNRSSKQFSETSKMSEENQGDDSDKKELTESLPATGGDTGTGKKPHSLWNTALFFPCYFPENPDSSLGKLLFYVTSAEKSLKICVMILTYDPLLEAILDRHKAGVEVRVFTSYNSANDPMSGRAGKFFRKNGVPIRSLAMGQYSTEMHHKFAIVDDEAILTGSMNWNFLSINHQRENILITTESRIVSGFVEHFEFIWNKYDQEDHIIHEIDQEPEITPEPEPAPKPKPKPEDQTDNIFYPRRQRVNNPYTSKNKQ